MTARNLRHTVRSPDALISTLALPIMILLMFVYVFGGAMDVGGTFVDYVVPGIVLMCACFGASTTAISVSVDIAEGIVDRFRTMAISRSSFLTGHITESLLRNILATAVVVIVALAIGFRPTADPLRWLAAAALLALVVVALSWMSACFGLFASSPEAANGFTIFAMFIPYVSSAFVPPETMPDWLRGFAEHQPVTPVIETLRGLLVGTPIGNSAVLAVVWWGAIAVVCYGTALVLFRRKTRN
ncbi:ABC transporter permease [Nocardia flavorosea]|uniref:Transport permease protein n=1 Tax=Nocardia flavorosea TaxID=53429 RepID=A0A846YT24_9NOCA|nr:ABC transporter permease [Nocardia flavorosea]NKY60821.1 ABC transporter permease [Nocardia flavorosea]